MDNAWVGPVVVLALVVGTAGAVVGLGPFGGADSGSQLEAAVGDGPVPVSQCRTIDEPGRYVLTEDVVNSTARECITVVASDVVFDGQGHTLDAADVDHQTEGIAAGYTDPAIENVTIENLVVTDWSQGVGCRSVAANVTIRNVTARHNGLRTSSADGYGGESYQYQTPTEEQDQESGEHESEETYAIYVGDATHNVTVSDSLVVDNSVGILLTNTSNNVLRDNVIRNNSGGAVVLSGKTWHNRILDNRIVGNGGTGIFVGEHHRPARQNRTRIRGNVIRDNGRGVFVQNVNTQVAIRNNTIGETTNESLWVAVVDGNLTVADNVIRSGGGDGLVVDATSRVVLRNNTIRDVAGEGILLKFESRHNSLVNDRIHGARRGLYLTDTSGSTLVRGLVVGPSRNRSIALAGSGNNTIVDATVRGNGSIVVESPGNRLRNVSLDSGRISLTGTDVQLSPVTDIPPPPGGLYRVGVGVQVRQPGVVTARGDPTVLTVYYPPDARNVTLWRWSPTGTWERLTNATAAPDRPALTTRLPSNGDFLVVPLSTAPFTTPTPTPTPTATQTSRSTTLDGPQTGTQGSTRPTVGVTPGFGISIALLALGVGLLVRVGFRRRPR